MKRIAHISNKNNIQLLFLIVVCIFLNCFSLKSQEYSILEDSAITWKTQVIQFSNYKGYIFPKEYGVLYDKKAIERGDLKEYFSLDSTTVCMINDQLTEDNFISANRRLMDTRHKEIYEYLEKNPGSYNLDALKKDEKYFWEKFEKDKKEWGKIVTYADRQFLGFISNKEEKIVIIRLIDPKKDPYNLNKYIDKRFIPCSSNLYYNLSLGTLSLGEDIPRSNRTSSNIKQ